MAKDVKIYDGADWYSIKGPQGDDGAKGDAGVPGPTAVSTDANNVVELGTDGLLKLDPAKLDSRFVNLTGDTMTGPLIVRPAAAAAAGTGHIQVVNSAGAFQPVVSGVGYGTGSTQPVFRMAKARGTAEAPESVQANDTLGQVNFQGCGPDGVFRTTANINVNCDATPAVGSTHIRGRMGFLVNDGTGIKTPVIVYGDRVDLTVPLKLPATATVPSISATNATSGVTLGQDSWGFMSSAGVNRTTWSVSGTQNNYVMDTPSADPSAATYILLRTAGNEVSIRAQQNGFDSLVSGSAGGLVVGTNATSNGEMAFQTNGLVRSTITNDGNLGVGWLAPTNRLEVFGTTLLRGTCEVTGNITSAGTAHNFAANSIPVSAISGLPVAATVAPLPNAAVAAVGTSTAYARQDHVHILPTAAQVGALTQAQGDARYVNMEGDTMTGPLIVPEVSGSNYVAAPLLSASGAIVGPLYNITDTKNAPDKQRVVFFIDETAGRGDFIISLINDAGTATQGSVNFGRDGRVTFLPQSINADAIGHDEIKLFTASGTIPASCHGFTVFGSALNADITLTLPNPAPSGTRFEVISNVQGTGKYCFIQAPAGVPMYYNKGTGDGLSAGGAGALGRVRLRGPVTRARVVSFGNQWFITGDIVGL
jgi:hypothetical protein